MFNLNRIYNLDCMEAMKEIPDNFFQLAICDPPYGIGHDGQRQRVHNNRKHNRKFHARKGWDKEPPPPEYFRELERVSENQIIFGGNYFAPMLNRGTKGWLVWDKGQHGLSQSDCELAYSSFDLPTRVVIINRAALQQDGNTIHPTQKPVRLYRWILKNYARPGDRVLDTHAGAGQAVSPVTKWGLISWLLRSTQIIAGRRRDGWSMRGRKYGLTTCRQSERNR